MRIGVFQFKPTCDVRENYGAVQRAVTAASDAGVRLLVFAECALTGYPPLETPSAAGIDFDAVDECLRDAGVLAHRHSMYIALGTVRREGGRYYNSVVLITPDGEPGMIYDKRALWGWDLDNFREGCSQGVADIDVIKVGFRICYEVRFPEYFRELFTGGAELCFVSFCDVSEHSDPNRYELIKAHLRTRAVENVLTVISVNSVSNNQTAPTAVFNSDGHVEAEAPLNTEHLLIYDYEKTRLSYSAEGRKKHSEFLTGKGNRI